MARRGKHRSRLNGVVLLLAFALIALCVVRSMSDKDELERIPVADESVEAVDGFVEAISGSFDGAQDFFQGLFDLFSLTADEAALPVMADADNLEVHFIDVGQGKAILVKAQGEAALIDAGENGQGNTVVSYLRQHGVERLDLLIGTHPHSDHIGDMDMVIKTFDIGKVILPSIPDEAVPTTRTYTDLLLSIAEKGLQITVAEPGLELDLGDAMLTILGPAEAYTDLNNLSVAARLVYGETAFLFTGDMEAPAEEDVLATRRTLRADVLDVAHHGSGSSSTEAFLAKVKPSIAVISCGIDNSYGHPDRDAVERVKAAGAAIYRTDLDGAVVVASDGAEVSVETEK